MHKTISIAEDSGCLQGLFETLFADGPFDMLHIKGHADNDVLLGPVFYMEDETGRLDKVTPQRLWDKTLKDIAAPAALLFLSGSSTGKADKVTESESFAHQMVAQWFQGCWAGACRYRIPAPSV